LLWRLYILSNLTTTLGALAVDLGCFPFDIEPSSPMSALPFRKFTTFRVLPDLKKLL
jgi:hypothetical protein